MSATRLGDVVGSKSTARRSSQTSFALALPKIPRNIRARTREAPRHLPWPSAVSPHYSHMVWTSICACPRQFLLEHRGPVDLRALPLSECKRDLHRLLRQVAGCKPSSTARYYSSTATNSVSRGRHQADQRWHSGLPIGAGRGRARPYPQACQPSAVACGARPGPAWPFHRQTRR
jgi:hypothetical protein